MGGQADEFIFHLLHSLERRDILHDDKYSSALNIGRQQVLKIFRRERDCIEQNGKACAIGVPDHFLVLENGLAGSNGTGDGELVVSQLSLIAIKDLNMVRL